MAGRRHRGDGWGNSFSSPLQLPKLNCELLISSNCAVERCLQIPEVLAWNHKSQLDSLADALWWLCSVFHGFARNCGQHYKGQANSRECSLYLRVQTHQGKPGVWINKKWIFLIMQVEFVHYGSTTTREIKIKTGIKSPTLGIFHKQDSFAGSLHKQPESSSSAQLLTFQHEQG